MWPLLIPIITAAMNKKQEKEARETDARRGRRIRASAAARGSGRHAWTQWYLGYPDRAVAIARRGIELARSIGHPFSSSFAMSFAAYLWLCRGEAAAAIAQLPADMQGIGEDFAEAIKGKVRPPRHENAWGPLFAYLCRKGLLVKTGAWKPMRKRSSNGRLSPVYSRRPIGGAIGEKQLETAQ